MLTDLAAERVHKAIHCLLLLFALHAESALSATVSLRTSGTSSGLQVKLLQGLIDPHNVGFKLRLVGLRLSAW